MGVAAEDGLSFPRSLSVWWSSEAEYVLQRIERWAAFARGYNRLRSVRLSPGRLTMRAEPETGWTVGRSASRLVIDTSWTASPRGLRPAPPSDRSRLRCCGALDYQSNGNLDSNCLEAYSLDHSIYFKTIGDLRSERPAPLDCGDFLASDFDDDDDDGVAGNEQEESDAALANRLGSVELREQLQRLSRESEEDEVDGAPAVIQLCRSALDEDVVNNNIRLLTLRAVGRAAP